MTNTVGFSLTKADLVRFVSDKLTGLIIDSPWTMTILPGKFAGYSVHIATDTASEEAVESILNYYKQLSPTSTVTTTVT